MDIFTKVTWLLLLLLVMKGNAQNFIINGTDNLVDTAVVSRVFEFGTDWRGPARSSIRMRFNLNREVVDQDGGRMETFSFRPEGSSTPVDVLFDRFYYYLEPPFFFPLATETSALVCRAISKEQGHVNEIIITSGTPSCNGQYTFIVTIGQTVDTATSTIHFIGGTPPNFLELNQVTSTSTDTFYGLLGTTFQTTIDRTQTVRINATDIIGNPGGSIQWFLTAAGSTGRIPLPGSLTGITIETPQIGTSILQIGEINAAHLGEYVAVATNSEGTDTASAFITEGVAPFIIRGSGQSGISNFSVGANRAITPGDTVSIRAEDQQSNPSAVTTWSYSSSALGPFAPISSGGTNSISQTGTSNIGIDSTLTITNTQDAQLGYYRAEAVNAFGTSTSTTLVGRSPGIRRGSGVISVGGTEDIGTSFTGAIGSTVAIIAEDMNGFPQSSYRWQRIDINDVITNIGSGGQFNIVESISNGRLRSTLTITGVRRENLGIYWVTADNGLAPDDLVQSLVGMPPTIRVLTGVGTDGSGEIGQDIQIPDSNRLRITACLIGGFPRANFFQFREDNTNLHYVQQDPPNDNCYIYDEGEFELTCGTTISARASNTEFGFGNEPMSRITFPGPRIIRSSGRCDQGSTKSSIQIGDQLCLYDLSSFDITCSVERVSIPEFDFQWQHQGNDIDNMSGRYIINRENMMSSKLTVVNASINDVGRYTCKVTSTCGETDASYTDANHYSYRYFCDENKASICTRSINGGPETTVVSSVCDQFGLERPTCTHCDWEMSPWSSCSYLTCHRGRRTRTVQCSCDGEDREDRNCSRHSPRPESVDQCGPKVICTLTFEWRAYSFGACSATCGVAYRQRRVECVSSITKNVVSDQQCVALFKLKTIKRCVTRPC